MRGLFSQHFQEAAMKIGSTPHIAELVLWVSERKEESLRKLRGRCLGKLLKGIASFWLSPRQGQDGGVFRVTPDGRALEVCGNGPEAMACALGETLQCGLIDSESSSTKGKVGRFVLDLPRQRREEPLKINRGKVDA
jgi:hypothetical protein